MSQALFQVATQTERYILIGIESLTFTISYQTDLSDSKITIILQDHYLVCLANFQELSTLSKHYPCTAELTQKAPRLTTCIARSFEPNYVTHTFSPHTPAPASITSTSFYYSIPNPFPLSNTVDTSQLQDCSYSALSTSTLLWRRSTNPVLSTAAALCQGGNSFHFNEFHLNRPRGLPVTSGDSALLTTDSNVPLCSSHVI